MGRLKEIKIYAYGYIKEEDGVFTAICVNMGIFGQGNTPDEAYDGLINATDAYVKYILEKHPDDLDKYFNRLAPAKFVKEYTRGIENLQKMLKARSCAPRQPRTFIPVRNFAQAISYAQA